MLSNETAVADVAERYNATSDPLYTDSDQVGFGDREELLAKTGPRTVDSDGDGIPDGEEAAAGDDPTMFDPLPPTVTVHVAKFDDPSALDFQGGKTKYKLLYEVEDARGVRARR